MHAAFCQDLPMPLKAWISWSSGKDSAFALHRVRQSGEFEVSGRADHAN